MRYAFYITPENDHPLTLAAADWLGRNPFTGAASTLRPAAGFDADELAALTADPRRYGFHGTIKAPFLLAPGTDEAQLLAAFAGFAEEMDAFEIPALTVGQLGAFFALVPAVACPMLQVLADATVRRFDAFRAPLSPEDLARRKPDLLSKAQRANLISFGYPYVFDQFRFHMTLTGPVPAEQQAAIKALLLERFAPFVGKPLVVAALALFVEPARGAPFDVHSSMPLGGTAKRKMS